MIKQPKGMLENRGNCGVVAIASTLDLHYDVVHRYFTGQGSYFKGGMDHAELSGAIINLGSTFTILPRPDYNFERLTLKNWIENEAVKNATYIIHLGNHYVAVRNGIVVDQSSGAPVIEHRCKNWRVKEAWKIKKGLYSGAGDKDKIEKIVKKRKSNRPRYNYAFTAENRDLLPGEYYKRIKVKAKGFRRAHTTLKKYNTEGKEIRCYYSSLNLSNTTWKYGKGKKSYFTLPEGFVLDKLEED